MADDERHLVRRAQARRDEQVALVLAIVVVGDDDDLAAGECGDGGGDVLVAIVHAGLPIRHCEPTGPARSGRPDDKLREAIQGRSAPTPGLLRRFAPRNDDFLAAFASSEHPARYRCGRASGHAGGSPTWPRWRR